MSTVTKTALIRAAGSCWSANSLWLSLPSMLLLCVDVLLRRCSQNVSPKRLCTLSKLQ
jgi:hypothetical protein